MLLLSGGHTITSSHCHDVLSGDDDHSPDEYLELSTVEPSIRLARALLEELAAEKLKERER